MRLGFSRGPALAANDGRDKGLDFIRGLSETWILQSVVIPGWNWAALDWVRRFLPALGGLGGPGIGGFGIG